MKNSVLACLLTILAAGVAPVAQATVSPTASIQLKVGRPEIGAPVLLDIATPRLQCNSPSLVSAEVTESVSERMPFGPVQHLTIELVDNNPVEPIFCDLVGDARFLIPVARLRAPIITTTITLRDETANADGSTTLEVTELPSPEWRVDRTLASGTIPSDPTVLDDVRVLMHSNGEPRAASRNDELKRVYLRGGFSQGSEPWAIFPVYVGRVPEGFTIERVTRLTAEAYFDLVDAGLAPEPGGQPYFATEIQEFTTVQHRIPVEASGSWYNPETAGQGLSIQVIDAQRVIAYWYRFDPKGDPVWLFGDGVVSAPEPNTPGVVVEFKAFLSEGPRSTDEPALIPWGEWRLRFTSCDQAQFSWQPALEGWVPGDTPVTQLAGNGASDCAARRRSTLN